MRSMQSAGEAASGSRLPDYRPDYTCVNRNIEWRTVPHKHGTAFCLGASLVKVTGNGMARDGRQRQDVNTVGFAHTDSQCGILPIDVFQKQRRYLKGTETEIHQAANDRVIALTLWIRLFKGRHYVASSSALRYSGSEASRQRAAWGIAAMSASTGSACLKARNRR